MVKDLKVINKRAVIYSRISKDEQSKYSLDEQTVKCREHLEKEGYEIVDIFVDDGYSSKTMKRPELQRMLAAIKSKSFDTICVWNSDRLTRTTLDGLTMVITMFRPSGIEFVSVTEEIDTSTPDGMMMFTIRLSMAQREREKIAERSSMGQSARAKTGKRNTSARPYGYNVVEDLFLVINEEESRIVKQIFEWYLQGWGRIKIARTLNSMGIPANRGGKWPEKIIGDILKNITYTGAVHYKRKGSKETDRIIVRNVHEVIITEEVYDQAQKIFLRRREHDMNLSSYEFPYSTILKCAMCGRSFHGKLKTKPRHGQPYHYYRCSGKYRPESECTASDIIEKKVTEMLFKHIDIMENNFQDNPIVEQSVDIEKERKRLDKLINGSRERRKKYSRAMADEKMTYEEYTDLIDEEKKLAETWQAEMDKLPKKALQTGKTSKDAANKLKHIANEWNSISNSDRKLAIQTLFSRIIIGKVNGEWKLLGIDLA